MQKVSSTLRTQINNQILYRLILINSNYFSRSTSIDKLSEPDLQGQLNIKVSYIESKRATVRQWHRVLAKVRADKFEIILFRDNDSEEVNFASVLTFGL